MPHPQQNPWYDPPPRRRRMRRRDKVEFVVAAVMLAGLLGLLLFGAARDSPRPAESTPSLTPP